MLTHDNSLTLSYTRGNSPHVIFLVSFEWFIRMSSLFVTFQVFVDVMHVAMVTAIASLLFAIFV